MRIWLLLLICVGSWPNKSESHDSLDFSLDEHYSMICLRVFRLMFRLFIFVVMYDNVFSQLHIHRMKPGLSLCLLCVIVL